MKKILLSGLTIFAVVAMVAGVTAAVFSDTESIGSNTVGAATVDISLNNDENEATLDKPVDADNLVPGEWSGWYYINVYNDGSVDSDVYMHGDSFAGTGGICANTNLAVEANSGSGWYEKYSGPLMDADEDNRVKLKVAPLEAEDTLNVRQRVELDEDAPDSAQGKECTWTEVFVAENVAP